RRGDAVGKLGLEGGLVILVFLQAFDGGGDAGTHLGRILDGLQGLLFQGRGAAVPEEGGSVGAVQERGRAARELLAATAPRAGLGACEPMLALAAGGARGRGD